MGRPRYAANDVRARQKLINAFWRILEQVPYEQITARQIVAAANVNKNTFYYYFTNTEDLAAAAVQSLMIRRVPLLLLSGEMSSGERVRELLAEDPEMGVSLHRIHTLNASNGTSLLPLLEKEFMGIWLDLLGLERDELPPEDLAALHFIIGGVLTLHRVTTLENAPDVLPRFMAAPLGQACVAYLRSLAKTRDLSDAPDGSRAR